MKQKMHQERRLQVGNLDLAGRGKRRVVIEQLIHVELVVECECDRHLVDTQRPELQCLLTSLEPAEVMAHALLIPTRHSHRIIVDQEMRVVVLSKAHSGIGIFENDEIGARGRIEIGRVIVIGKQGVFPVVLKQIHLGLHGRGRRFGNQAQHVERG